MVYLRVDEILKERKKTKYWFVNNMGMSYQVISDMLNRESIAIRFDTIDKVCRVLECEPGDLFVRE